MKKASPLLILLFSMAICAAWGTEGTASTSNRPKIVVTTTLIETAVRDLAGQDIEITRLLPPGSCPGHFDLEPGQVAALSSSGLFVRHDYQVSMDAGVEKAGLDSHGIVSLASLPTFMIPDHYVALCTELSNRLAQEWPDRALALAQRLGQIKEKSTGMEQDLRRRTEVLRGRRVLCARYQKDFCEWIGLNVIASFNAGTDESAWQLNRAVDMGKTAGAEVVVGNLQWGPKHLDALREATDLPGIMLSNFPESGDEGAYWACVENNVNALLKGFHEPGH